MKRIPAPATRKATDIAVLVSAERIRRPASLAVSTKRTAQGFGCDEVIHVARPVASLFVGALVFQLISHVSHLAKPAA